MIQLKNVSYEFKTNEKVFENFSFTFYPGNIYGIIGKNGSGKSTLLKILTNNLKKYQGEIIFDQIYKIAYCPDFLFLSKNETLKSFLKDICLIKKIKFDSKKAIEICDLLSLKLKEKYSHMSQGTKSKIRFSQILLEESDIYIFDEPFDNIDEDTIKKMWEKIILLKNKGKIIIIVSHNLIELRSHIDEEIDMEKYHD